MKRLTGNSSFKTALLLGLLTVSLPCPVRAGEAIVFSGEKSKAGPALPAGPDRKALPELERGPSLFPTEPPEERQVVPNRRRTLDPRERRRLQEARDEENNWMFINKGDLKEREDDGGIFSRNADSQFLQKPQEGSRDLTFERQDDPRERSPGNVARDAKPQPDPGAEEQEQFLRNVARSKARDDRDGAHTQKELNLRGLLDTSRAPKDDPNAPGDYSLRDLFGDGGKSARDQQAKRQEYQRFIRTAPGTADQPATSSDGALGARPDWMSRPAGASGSGLSSENSLNRSPGTPIWGNTPNAGSPNSRIAGPAASGFSTPSVPRSGFSSGSAAPGQPFPNTPAPVDRTFGGESRPPTRSGVGGR